MMCDGSKLIHHNISTATFLHPFFLFCCQTIITVSFNPLNSYNQYVLQWKEYHQVRLVLFWITDKVDMQFSFDIII